MKRFIQFITLSIFLLLYVSVSAQVQPVELRIVSTNTDNLPSVELTLMSRDANGNIAPLDTVLIAVEHNGEYISNAQVVGTESVGTMTVFLLDLPPGVSDQVDLMKEAISDFATPSFMQEQVDYVSIYRVDEVNAFEMLPATFFYNAIINLFATGIETQSGPTALIDSVGDVLSRIDSIKPEPNLTASIVVFSDGTDSVSTNYTAQEVQSLALEKGVRIYTVVVDNANLVTDNGRIFMEELATATNGGSALLTDRTSIKLLYERIVEFRDLPIIRYQSSNLTPGSASVIVSLPDYPNVPPVSTTIEVPASIPQVAIDVPEESRQLTLPDLAEPVRLSIPTTVTWLDGVDRTVTQAQVWLDGRVIQDVDLAAVDLSDISAEFYLTYGSNNIQVAIVDDVGQAGQSPPLILTVEEGDRSIPAPLNTGFNFPWRVIWYVLLCIFILGLLYYFFRVAARRRGPATKKPAISRSERRAAAKRERALKEKQAQAKASSQKPSAPTTAKEQSVYAPVLDDKASAAPPPAPAPSFRTGNPFIEVLDARSSIPAQVPIKRSEFLIGRSPTVDLPLTEDTSVSRIHATIVQDKNAFMIFDEQSTSGTFVNEREVPEYGMKLSSGDEIHIGTVHLRFNS